MIVLRFTIGQTTQEVRTPRTEVVVGSAPSADVTIHNAGVPGHALRLRRDGSEVHLEVLGTERRLTLRVGDIVEVDGLGVALVGLLPLESPSLPIFGGYDDTEAAAAPTFELVEEGPRLRRTTAATHTPAPTASPAASPAAAMTPTTTPPTTRAAPADTHRRRSRTRAAAAASVAATASQAGAGLAHARSLRSRPLTPEEKLAALKPLRFPDPNFGTELVHQLKRSPFFALSLGVHLLVFFIIFLLDTTSTRPSHAGPGTLNAFLDAERTELAEPLPDLPDEGLPLEAMKLPDLPELELEHEEQPEQDRPPPPSPFRESLEEDELPEPPQVGIMPGLRVASIRLRPRKPKMPKVDLKQVFTKGSAGSTNQRSAEVVRAQLGSRRSGNGASLDDLKRQDVLVVAGTFDHVGRVLDALRIEYVRKAPWSLTAPTIEDFRSYKIVFWNCGESLRPDRMAAIGERLQAFVRNGGYLFTTDWGVANVLPYAFDGYLSTNGNSAHLPEMVLTIEPSKSARDHPLLEGVFHEGVQGKWWLEQASFDMALGRKDAVTVLIESPMLRDTFNRSPAVAATFHYGRGRVLHTMGHYYQEAGNLAGTISAHRLALNFVLMRLDQDRKPAR